MKKELVELKWKNKQIKVSATVVPWYYEGIGLMFSRCEKARILLFNFKRDINLAIHSWFVFYPFIAVWLDSDGRIVDVQKIMPFRGSVLPKCGKFSRLIEIPINSANKRVVDFILKNEKSLQIFYRR